MENYRDRISTSTLLTNKGLFVKYVGAVAKTKRLPFDRLRANGDMLKLFDFSAHAELVEAYNRFGQQPVLT